ncbi:MAG: flavin reductase [Clostridiales bacterium]|nr:flavin reductase [Clostridiales bacterium]
MKKEFIHKPDKISEMWPGELEAFSWHDFVAAIPSPLFLITTYKSNGKENACLQSWSTFIGDKGEFICIIGSVSKRGHLYQTLKETKCCVLNFPSRDVYDKCTKTIDNNGFDDDEITIAGLTAEKAITVNAPRIKECFLNIECEMLWEHEHFEDSRDVTVALRATHIYMDSDRYDESKLGRYGKTGYMYNINSPRNPDTGEITPECFGAVELYK